MITTRAMELNTPYWAKDVRMPLRVPCQECWAPADVLYRYVPPELQEKGVDTSLVVGYCSDCAEGLGMLDTLPGGAPWLRRDFSACHFGKADG